MMVSQSLGSQKMTKHAQLEDLNRRLVLLEGERKAQYETAQTNIRQNQCIIKQMKTENKTLRHQIAQLHNDSSQTPENKSSAKLAELYHHKRKLNCLKDEVAQKEKYFQQLKDKLTELKTNAAGTTDLNSQDMRQIRTLENRLDKVGLKYNEARSIGHTYQNIVQRLKEERVGFDQHIGNLEQMVKAKESDYEDLLLLSHDAYHAKEMAQAELHRFEQGVMEERNQRDKEVQEKKALVQQRVEMNQRLEANEKMQKSAKEMDLVSTTAAKTSQEMASSAVGNQTTVAQDDCIKKCKEYEQALRMIKESTGVCDTNEVIQKFLTQEDTQLALQSSNKQAMSQIESLQSQRDKLKDGLDAQLYQCGSSAGTRKFAKEEVEQHLLAAIDKHDRAQKKYKETQEKLNKARQAVTFISSKVRSMLTKGDDAGDLLEDESDLDAQCSAILDNLRKVLERFTIDPNSSDFTVDTENFDQYVMKATSRAYLAKQADEDGEQEEEYEDDENVAATDGGEVFTAQQLKQQSDQILASKKKRGKKK